MLIGLTGRAQAGKDTVYGVIAERFGHLLTVERRAFADRLYESAARALDVTVSELRLWKTDDRITVDIRDNDPDILGGSYPRVRLSIREFLQRYGTEAHRDVFGRDFWVDALDLTHHGRIVVVTDVRFLNEADAILEAGGYVVRVEGPYVGDDDHVSETPIAPDLVDFSIDNTARDDGMAALGAEVDRVVRTIASECGWM